jgi:hypothetical protein
MPPKAYNLISAGGLTLCSLMADGPDEVYTAVAQITEITNPKFTIEAGNIVRLADQEMPSKKKKAKTDAVAVPIPVPVIPAIYKEAPEDDRALLPEFPHEDIQWTFDRSYGEISGFVSYDVPYYIIPRRTPATRTSVKRIHADAFSDEEITACQCYGRGRFVAHPDKAAIFDKQRKHVYTKGRWRPSIIKWVHEHLFEKKLSAEILTGAKETCKQIRDTQVNNINSRIRMDEQNIASVKITLLAHIRSRDGNQMTLAALEKTAAFDIEAQLRRITEMPIVKDTQLSGSVLKVLVGPIQIAMGSRTYAIGLVQIAVNLENGQILFSNCTRRLNNRPHPHVQTNGTPCWGEIQVSIMDLLARWMLAELITVIVRYLQSVDPKDSWGGSIVNWPEIPKPVVEVAVVATTPSEVPVANAAVAEPEEDEDDESTEEDIPF